MVALTELENLSLNLHGCIFLVVSSKQITNTMEIVSIVLVVTQTASKLIT